MAVLVTGGKGFIGAVVIRQLLASGQAAVCLDLKSTPGRLADVADRTVMLDGGMPSVQRLTEIIREHDIDRIAHLVFFISAPGNADEIRTEVRTMVSETVDLFEAARLTGVRRVVFPSSIHYYGPQWLHGETLLDEECPSLTTDIYGVSKRLGETVASVYNMRANMSVVSLRIPAVYGPGGRVGARGVNVAAVECALGRPARLPFAAADKVCVGHVEDVAHAVVTLLAAESPRRLVYNVGGHTLSYWEMASLIHRFLPEAQISFDETTGRSDLPYLIDYSRIREEFGCEHRGLTDGYRDLINHTRRGAGLLEV